MIALGIAVLTLIIAVLGVLVRISMQMQRTLDRVEQLEVGLLESKRNWDRFFPRAERLTKLAEAAEERATNGD